MDIKILFKGPVDDSVREGLGIANCMAHTGSYVDTPVFQEGHGEDYGKSVYATNVKGWGRLKGLQPNHSAPVNFAYLDRAVAAAAEAEANGTENTGISITVDDKERLWWEQMAPSLADQGFEISLGE